MEIDSKVVKEYKLDCIYCNKTVRRYSSWRDWVKRNSHYNCYTKEREKQLNAYMVELFQQEMINKERRCSV
jgi:hypothetical protein